MEAWQVNFKVPFQATGKKEEINFYLRARDLQTLHSLNKEQFNILLFQLVHYFKSDLLNDEPVLVTLDPINLASKRFYKPVMIDNLKDNPTLYNYGMQSETKLKLMDYDLLEAIFLIAAINQAAWVFQDSSNDYSTLYYQYRDGFLDSHSEEENKILLNYLD